MRASICLFALLLIAARFPALAQGVSRLADPMVKGQPVDHCADIDVDGPSDCTARGEAKAALNVCLANGYSAEAGWHVRPGAGTAMRFIVEYDMHAGEVGGRWEPKPSNGTFDWIACKK